MICPRCNTNNENSVYCTGCGYKLENTANTPLNNNVGGMNPENNNTNVTNVNANTNYTNDVNQSNMNNIDNTNFTNNNTITNGIKSKKTIFIIILVMIAIVVGFVVFKNVKKDDSKGNESIENKSGKEIISIFYNDKVALFDEDGKKLTDFIYDSVHWFRAKDKKFYSVLKNGTSYEVMDEYGNTIIKPRLYREITPFNGMLLVKNNKGNFLINTDNEVLFDVSDDNYIYNIYASIIYNKGMYYVYDDGEKIFEFKKVSNETSAPKIEGRDGVLLLINYNNEIYILNLKTKNSLVTKISVEKDYKIGTYTVNESNELTLLKLRTSITDSDDNIYYDHGNIKKFSYSCPKILKRNDTYVCYKDMKYYDYDGNLISIEKIERVYMDDNNYAFNTDSSVSFVVDNKVVKTINGYYVWPRSGSTKLYYVLVKTSSNPNEDEPNVAYYTKNGEKAFNGGTYSSSEFDNNNSAIFLDYVDKSVSDKVIYYLVDANGNKKSDNYDKITKQYCYGTTCHYIVQKDGKYGLINYDLKLIYEPVYDDIDIEKYDGKYFAYLEKDDYYILADAYQEKQYLTSKEKIDLDDIFYIINPTNNKAEFFMYKDNEFKLVYEESGGNE